MECAVINGKLFENVNLLAKDSMYVFIETTAGITDANSTDFLYTDQIQFGSGTASTKSRISHLDSRCSFFIPSKVFDNGAKLRITYLFESNQIYGFILDHNDHKWTNYHWTNSKPYVIYGYAGIPSGKHSMLIPEPECIFMPIQVLL
jgi:hypothetical protein